MEEPAAAAKIVQISYLDLVAGKDLTDYVEEAFGEQGLGILAVAGVPLCAEGRTRLLKLAHDFAVLPPEVKEAYEHSESSYSFGWSHGKEQFEGRPDVAKGSYYANPLFDTPFEDELIIQQFPSFAHPNIWPDLHVHGFSEAFRSMGRSLVDVGLLLAKQCDAYVKHRNPAYDIDKLERVLRSSRCCKGRLLYYFPRQCERQQQQQQQQQSSSNSESSSPAWCGWHNDHGSLTGLLPGLYMDSNGSIVTPEQDDKSGLYIMSKQGQGPVRAEVPPGTSMLFQIGETAQIHTGGILQATPHCVQSCSKEGVSRAAFAVFMEPEWGEPMTCPSGCPAPVPAAGHECPPPAIQSALAVANLPAGVPPLADRFTPGMTFGDFTDATLKSFLVT